MTVVVTEPPATETGAAFAAGVAAAASVTAAETASDAEATAEAAVVAAAAAVETAEAAGSAAADAQITAWSVEQRLDRLEERYDDVIDLFDHLINGEPGAPAVEESSTLPPVVTTTTTTTPGGPDSEKDQDGKGHRTRRSGGWGSNAWFGSRR